MLCFRVKSLFRGKIFVSDVDSPCLGNSIEPALHTEYPQSSATHRESVENVENFWNDEANNDDDGDGTSCNWLVTEVRSLSNQNTDNAMEIGENLTENTDSIATDHSSGSTLFLPRYLPNFQAAGLKFD